MFRPDHLGLAFRFLRTSRQLKQMQVAQRAGITSSMLSGYENGRKQPTLATLEKILEAMSCGLPDLLAALEVVREGGAAVHPESAFPRESSARASEPGSPSPRSFAAAFDLEMIFGSATPLDQEEAAAFGEMLSGYCRWLRHLRQVGAAGLRSSPLPSGSMRAALSHKIGPGTP